MKREKISHLYLLFFFPLLSHLLSSPFFVHPSSPKHTFHHGFLSLRCPFFVLSASPSLSLLAYCSFRSCFVQSPFFFFQSCGVECVLDLLLCLVFKRERRGRWVGGGSEYAAARRLPFFWLFFLLLYMATLRDQWWGCPRLDVRY
jgi:hypothetical protein